MAPLCTALGSHRRRGAGYSSEPWPSAESLALTLALSPAQNPTPGYAFQAPAVRVAASVGYAARGTACDAGLRLRAAPLRRAFR